eukprot:TRINITY_DN4094_c0_g1_i5.p1 TRINITY_DN4094_c0_g1~~TRINITY_DN4094_c0_g1_i5.p1  ORF type:complete len:259 (+),score=50.59 TRINITY_DN4094_c0_g1_i5:59-835(+)
MISQMNEITSKLIETLTSFEGILSDVEVEKLKQIINLGITSESSSKGKARRQYRLALEFILQNEEAPQKLKVVFDLLNQKLEELKGDGFGPNNRQLRLSFVEQKKVYFYGSEMPPVKTSEILTGFVSQKVRQTFTFEFSKLYTQCMRCVLAPIRPLPGKQKQQLLSLLFSTFVIDPELHSQIYEEQKNYNAGCLLNLVKFQLSEIPKHPFYTKESFFNVNDCERWWQLKKENLERVGGDAEKSGYYFGVFGGSLFWSK